MASAVLTVKSCRVHTALKEDRSQS